MPGKMLYIYIHRCKISGKSYIGQTNNLHQRWIAHKSEARTGSAYAFHRAIRKYNEENFYQEILFSTPHREIANRAEIFLIAYHNTFGNGYNLTVGGDSLGTGTNHPVYGMKFPEQSKKLAGNGNYFYGKTGDKSPSFSGYYITPWGKFGSTYMACKDKNVSEMTILKWCKNPNQIINSWNLRQSKYLKSFKESPVNKTFKELGFDFEEQKS